MIDAFALLMLDQLLAAPVEERTLAALRRRLADPRRVLGELRGPWSALGGKPPMCEIAREAQIAVAS